MSEKFMRIGGTDGNVARGLRLDKFGNVKGNIEEVLAENKIIQARSTLSITFEPLGRGLWLGYRLTSRADTRLVLFPRGGGTTLGGPASTLVLVDAEDSDRAGNLAPEEYLSPEMRVDISNRSEHPVELRVLVAMHKY